MSSETNKICGCKGIRKCLLCEEQNETSVDLLRNKQAKHVYNYCDGCGLCWPDCKVVDNLFELPLYLGKLNLFLDFISEDEELRSISEIDSIPWMPSQSGRRKQDFGPKVNFKKKKVKIGEFKGFPKFTGNILQKLKNIPMLSDFQPVELCHLEYTPERGSSIDPHVDDFWLWGERLVTINLGSSTVLSLTPSSDNICECPKDCENHFRNLPLWQDEQPLCNGKVHDDSTLKSFLNSVTSLDMQNHCLCKNNLCFQDCINVESSIFRTSKNFKDICNMFRSGKMSPEVSVRVELPPRSLLVLAGCARYNWYHQIKRQDVVSRRLAMTFRELTPEFLDDGKEYQMGKDLLSVANNFYNFS